MKPYNLLSNLTFIEHSVFKVTPRWGIYQCLIPSCWKGNKRKEWYSCTLQSSGYVASNLLFTLFFSDSHDETTRARNNSTSRLFVWQGFLLLSCWHIFRLRIWYGNWGDSGSVGKSSCCMCVKTWVQIPGIYAKSWSRLQECLCPQHCGGFLRLDGC